MLDASCWTKSLYTYMHPAVTLQLVVVRDDEFDLLIFLSCLSLAPLLISVSLLLLFYVLHNPWRLATSSLKLTSRASQVFIWGCLLLSRDYSSAPCLIDCGQGSKQELYWVCTCFFLFLFLFRALKELNFLFELFSESSHLLLLPIFHKASLLLLRSVSLLETLYLYDGRAEAISQSLHSWVLRGVGQCAISHWSCSL